MNIGLLLVDLQKDYFPGGKHELINPEAAASNAGKILELFREKKWSVFHVRHLCLESDASFFLPDTIGADFDEVCAPQPGEEIFIKHNPDSFLHTGLAAALENKGIEKLVVCGMMTHMCIDTTVRTAAGKGYAVDLIEDACATRDLFWGNMTIAAGQVHAVFMAALSEAFARVIKAGDWLKLS